MLKVLTVTTDLQQTRPLIQSLEKNGFDFEVIQTVWRGFGTKLIEVYNYLKEHPEVDRFIFCDAFDVVCLGTQSEFEEKLGEWSDKIVLSAEKGCWPDPKLERFYEPLKDHGFNYVNSGIYYSPSHIFIDLIERYSPKYEEDDQLFMSKMFLFESDEIMLDREQELFNSHSFISEVEYGYENGRVQILGNESVFIHKNGRTVDKKLDNLLL